MLAAIAAGAAIVGAGVGLLLRGIVNLRSSSTAELRSGALLARVIAVERSVIDAETGLRGYLITARRRSSHRFEPRNVPSLAKPLRSSAAPSTSMTERSPHARSATMLVPTRRTTCRRCWRWCAPTPRGHDRMP